MAARYAGCARVFGFFAMMLGAGLILDAHALHLGAAVLTGAGAAFAWGIWAERRGSRRSRAHLHQRGRP